jgi:hypothetical protein
MRISDDVKTAVTAWGSGESLRVLQLGHSSDVRQQAVYECIFRVLKVYIDESQAPETIEEVNADVSSTAELSTEERGAAASLVWLAIRNGWTAATAGHADHKYVTLTRESKAA